MSGCAVFGGSGVVDRRAGGTRDRVGSARFKTSSTRKLRFRNLLHGGFP